MSLAAAAASMPPVGAVAPDGACRDANTEVLPLRENAEPLERIRALG